MNSLEEILYSMDDGASYRIRKYINNQIGVEKFNSIDGKWYVCGGNERNKVIIEYELSLK